MLRVFFTGLAVLALAAPAIAAPRAKARQAPSAIDVSNQRTVALNAFVLSTGGEGGKVVAKLAKPLAAGGKIRLPLSKGKGCEYVARWEFEDAGDEAPVDLCNDPKIILTD